MCPSNLQLHSGLWKIKSMRVDVLQLIVGKESCPGTIKEYDNLYTTFSWACYRKEWLNVVFFLWLDLCFHLGQIKLQNWINESSFLSLKPPLCYQISEFPKIHSSELRNCKFLFSILVMTIGKPTNTKYWYDLRYL